MIHGSYPVASCKKTFLPHLSLAYSVTLCACFYCISDPVPQYGNRWIIIHFILHSSSVGWHRNYSITLMNPLTRKTNAVTAINFAPQVELSLQGWKALRSWVFIPYVLLNNFKWTENFLYGSVGGKFHFRHEIWVLFPYSGIFRFLRIQGLLRKCLASSFHTWQSRWYMKIPVFIIPCMKEA